MLTSQAKRTKRIERRCIAPVVAALQAGQISARSADVFLRLTPAEQQVELTRRLSEARQREERHRTVATAIKQYLDQLGDQQVDLHQLGSIIRQALS